jgi:hypothetical protein
MAPSRSKTIETNLQSDGHKIVEVPLLPNLLERRRKRIIKQSFPTLGIGSQHFMTAINSNVLSSFFLLLRLFQIFDHKGANPSRATFTMKTPRVGSISLAVIKTILDK